MAHAQLRAELGGWVDEFGRENSLYDPLTIAIGPLWQVRLAEFGLRPNVLIVFIYFEISTYNLDLYFRLNF